MKTCKKKVIIVMTSLYHGGAERSLINMLKEFPEEQYEIDLLLFKRMGMFLTQLPEYVRVLDTPKGLKRMYGSLKDSGIYALYRVFGNIVSSIISKDIREKRAIRWKYFYGKTIEKVEGTYDIAIAYISGEVLYFVDEKIHAKRKLVWIHNDYKSANHPRKYDYPHLCNMDGIVTISDSCVEILKEEFEEFSNKIYMLPNITSKKALLSQALEFVPEELKKNQPSILSIGRLNEQKGFDMAISAAAIMKKKGIAFSWFILGTGPLEEALKQQIEKEQVSDCVMLLGAKENPYAYIANCTLFVQPSRYEGKSVVLDEAKILGVPIVATSYPTVSDQLVKGVEGEIVSMNPEGIADGIMELLKDVNKRQRYIDYLQSHKYDNSDEIKGYINLLNEEDKGV